MLSLIQYTFGRLFTDPILAGVTASLIAIALVELFKLLRRKFRQRKLKSVLSITTGECRIIMPIRSRDSEGDLVTHKDAYAVSHLLELCHRLNIDTEAIPYDRVSETAKLTDLIVVGGGLTNDYCRKLLAKYCPAFQHIHGEARDNFDIKTEDYVTGFKAGEVSLIPNADEDFGVLVKLNYADLDQPRTIHLVFGYSSLGTAAAAYYLSRYYNNLYKHFGKSHYFIAIRTQRLESYKNVPTKFIDLTAEVFERLNAA